MQHGDRRRELVCSDRQRKVECGLTVAVAGSVRFNRRAAWRDCSGGLGRAQIAQQRGEGVCRATFGDIGIGAWEIASVQVLHIVQLLGSGIDPLKRNGSINGLGTWTCMGRRKPVSE